MVELDRRQRVTLIWAGIAVVVTAFEGSVLVIALPAVATEFGATTPALSELGSLLAIGALGALPLSTLADRFGRRRLIAVGVAGSSLANFASGFAPFSWPESDRLRGGILLLPQAGSPARFSCLCLQQLASKA